MSANLSNGPVRGLRCSVRADTAELALTRALGFLKSDVRVHVGEVVRQSAMPEGDLNVSPGDDPSGTSLPG